MAKCLQKIALNVSQAQLQEEVQGGGKGDSDSSDGKDKFYTIITVI